MPPQLCVGYFHIDAIRQNRGFACLTRHFQIAGVPGRHEPTVGEINYPYLFDLLDSLGYQGWIGCEYRPRGNTSQGLGWAARYGFHSPEVLPAR